MIVKEVGALLEKMILQSVSQSFARAMYGTHEKGKAAHLKLSLLF